MMFPKDRKYFQFQLQWSILISMLALTAACSSSGGQNHSSCAKVTKNDFKVDAKGLNDMYLCLQDLITNSAGESISLEMKMFFEMVLSKLPNMGKNGSHVAFMYLFWKTVELNKQANTLKIDSQQHLSEFNFLQFTEFEPLKEKIKKMSSSTDEATLKEVIVDLKEVLTELRTRMREMYKDLKEATIGQTSSFAYGVGSGCVCLRAVVASNFPEKVVTRVLCVASVAFTYHIHNLFGTTTEDLLALIQDVDSVIFETGYLLVKINSY